MKFLRGVYGLSTRVGGQNCPSAKKSLISALLGCFTISSPKYINGGSDSREMSPEVEQTESLRALRMLYVTVTWFSVIKSVIRSNYAKKWDQGSFPYPQTVLNKLQNIFFTYLLQEWWWKYNLRRKNWVQKISESSKCKFFFFYEFNKSQREEIQK